MSDNAGSAEAPSVPMPPALPPQSSPGPAAKPRPGIARFILSPVRSFLRRPVRGLAVLALLTLIGLSLGLIGAFFWFDHHLSAARRAVERGHTLTAIRHLHACRSLWPDRREVLILCARVAWRSGSWDEAGSLLDRYTEVHGDDDDVVLERLLLRGTRGELESAGPLLQARIARGGPQAALAREALIAGLLYRYNQTDAEKQIEDWRAHEPKSTLALFQRARLCEQREQSSEALEAYRQILEIDSEYDEVRLKMTATLLVLRQGKEALDHLEYLRRQLPDNAEVLAQMGQALDLLGRVDEARAALDECLRLNPDHAAALAERGRIASGDGDSRRAEELLARSVQIDPSNATARHQYFLALNLNGKKTEADQQMAAIRKIADDVRRINILIRYRLREAPNDPSVPYEIAMIALEAGLPREGLRWLQNTLQVDPNYLPAHSELSSFYYQNGNPILSARHRAIAQRLTTNQRQP